MGLQALIFIKVKAGSPYLPIQSDAIRQRQSSMLAKLRTGERHLVSCKFQ
jgi:hypothetical protein